MCSLEDPNFLLYESNSKNKAERIIVINGHPTINDPELLHKSATHLGKIYESGEVIGQLNYPGECDKNPISTISSSTTCTIPNPTDNLLNNLREVLDKKTRRLRKSSNTSSPKIKYLQKTKPPSPKSSYPEGNNSLRSIYTGLRDIFMGIGACRGLVRSDTFDKHQQELTRVKLISLLQIFPRIILNINQYQNICC